MNKKFVWFLGIFIVLYFVMQIISNFYLDFEWFKIKDGLNIFWTLIFTKFNVTLLFSLIFIILFFLNFLLIRILGGKGRIFTNNILDRIKLPIFGSTRKALYIILAIGIIILGFIMGAGAGAYWKEYLIYFNSVPFAGFPLDPIFNKDIGFYIFSLPFYEFLYGWAMSSLIIITIFSMIFHIINGGILFRNRLDFSLFSRTHLSVLLSLIVLLFGFSYRISAYGLLFSQRGKFYGAGYTAVNAELIAYDVCMIISFIAAALLLFNIFKKSFKLPIFVLVTLIPAYFLLGTIYPSIQQRFFVEPNELEMERPYINNNIKFTRLAYGLENLILKPFANNSNITYREIAKNKNTLDNIRIWDWRPLKQTYKQLQELKPYYQFIDVDVERYVINGSKIAVNLSARELAINKLSKNSQTWLNSHLIYTHGYGLVLSRVDRATTEGLPEMLVYDIPPKVNIPLDITEPRIYYGEHDNPYVITNTNISPGEFDYPYGDQNKYTIYKGSGGTVLDSFFKRLLFAISLKDINILISSNIKNDSRILYTQNIKEMVNKLTPFLEFDNDPYLVIADGRLFWFIDAYTMSDKFPYSTPIKTTGGTINYIRNSVKIVIDAYNGTMDYYVSDGKDPIIKTYSNIFPGLFKNISNMPDYLVSHIRFPESLFNVQSHILLRYHVTDINVFYNNEDPWEIPKQVYDDKEEPIQSYYLVTALPGESRSEFILIRPFTPINKDNMIAFLVAKCDPPYYGNMILYTLPKEKLSYGPAQIDARIEQDAEISQELTLWTQKGSGVIRGNMLIIPIEESLLFIQPLYLKAEKSEIPELKRVIVSFADKIIMEENLKAALEKLFLHGKYINESLAHDKDIEAKLKDYAGKAYNYFLRAEEHQKNGNWAGYGEEINHLREILKIMKDIQR
ncbi:MAG: UPF0182 family protein [Spirochaetes bacterium]|nr:UPF0182 family protein [Spirochaetota bacterium]